MTRFDIPHLPMCSQPSRWKHRAAVRSAGLVLCCVLVSVAACSVTNKAASPANTAPVVDALLVGVEEVRHIANYEELTVRSYADAHNPPPGNQNAPGTCRAAGISDLTFAGGWSEFRSVGYSGVTHDIDPGGLALVDSVSQAVAIYPDWHAAHQALDQLESLLTSCVAQHDPQYQFTIGHLDSSTLRITAPRWSHYYRVKKSALVSVGVVGIEPVERIAADVLQIVTDRIN